LSLEDCECLGLTQVVWQTRLFHNLVPAVAKLHSPIRSVR